MFTCICFAGEDFKARIRLSVHNETDWNLLTRALELLTKIYCVIALVMMRYLL